jgi:DNA-3-methyladenine glycosylase I
MASDTAPGRCAWAARASDADRRYHDEEWGVPLHDDRALFELLTLEGAQAGLSWSTVLARREGYRGAFAGFDAEEIAGWPEDRVDRLLLDPGIIRHRGKIASVLSNARALVALRATVPSFGEYVWSFTGGVPLQPGHTVPGDVPAATDLSKALSRDLKRHGFRFVGPTTAYAFMQAAGLTNDHTTDCFRYPALAG